MPPHDAPEIAQPASETELARVLADAASRGLKVAPRGGGTKSDWGNPPQHVDLVLSTLGLDRVLEHAAGDMTVTVEAGCTIAALQQALASHNQRLALDPLWADRATVGGVLATNDCGSLRHAFGSLRDLVLGVTVALPDGTLARRGGKVVKNVAGYDLPKLMVGAFGTLGVITQATFRLHPLPATSRTFQFVAPTPRDAAQFILAVHDSTLPVTGLQIETGSGQPCAASVRVEGSASVVESLGPGVTQIAAACGFAAFSAPGAPWSESQRLWETPGSIVKFTFLPSRFADLCGRMPKARWKLVAQGVGTALLHAAADATELGEIAHHVHSLGGSLAVLRGDNDVKRHVNPVTTSPALPLMRAIKKQFDPHRTLNPGRLGGGI